MRGKNIFIIAMIIAISGIVIDGYAGYIPKVYHKQGGNELVVASGGTVTFQSGSILTMAGATVDSVAAKRFLSTLTGAAGNAAIGLNSDKDTGLYWLANTGNRLGITAKGTSVAIFDSSGAMVTGAISATTTVTGAGILNTGKYYGLTAASAWSDTTGWTGPKLFIFAAADTLYIYKADHTIKKFAAL